MVKLLEAGWLQDAGRKVLPFWVAFEQWCVWWGYEELDELRLKRLVQTTPLFSSSFEQTEPWPIIIYFSQLGCQRVSNRVLRFGRICGFEIDAVHTTAMGGLSYLRKDRRE